MKITREVKTGILAISAIALFIFGYNFLKGKNLLESDRTFYVVYKDVEGLIPSSPVTINGLIVGKVKSIDFLNNQGNLIVTFNVNSDFEFSKNSFAQIHGTGLIGGKSLSVTPVHDKAQAAKNGDTLPGKVEEGILDIVNDRFTPLQEKLEVAIINANTLLTSLNKTLSKDTQEDIQSALKNLNHTMQSFKGASGKLNTLLDQNQEKLNSTFTNLDAMSTNLNTFTEGLSKVEIEKLGKNLKGIVANFDKIANDIQGGKGTMGKLLKDEKLYDNLERTSKQLELLLQDLRLNPKRYVHISVFGKNNKPYQKPADSIQ